MENEALQCAEVCPAELVDHRIHSANHLPLVWLTCKENKHKPSVQETFHPVKLSLSWSGLWTDKKQKGVTEGANYELTHSSEELLIKFKGHERAGQVTKPLFENAGNNMDVVVIQVYAVHIWNRKTHSDEVTYFKVM